MRVKSIFLCLIFVVVGCSDGKRYHKQKSAEKLKQAPSAIKEVLVFQDELNQEFADPETSPLPDRYRKDFNGLDFFVPDTAYRVVAQLERTPDAVPFLMPTTTDRTSQEVVYGIVSFKLQGKQHRLEVYQNRELIHEEGFEEYLFLPFLDDTNGEETYMGGRYLDLSIPEGDTIVLDFNKAYNPYCAYNKKYSCPIVPVVNTLNVAVKAGVKAFKK